jgi:hypothetical protein
MPLRFWAYVFGHEKRTMDWRLLGTQCSSQGTDDAYFTPETSTALAGRPSCFLFSLRCNSCSARSLHTDAVTALSIMGLVNLGLFFLGLRLFVFSTVPKHRSATTFYALLLTLFCWGYDPWDWSGFFHIGTLSHVLPYPSTFSAALTLIAIGVNGLRIESKRQIWLAPIFLIAITVLISHPTTFLFLVAGLISQSCTEKGSVSSQIVLVGSLLSLAFLVAAFWPYFPLLSLFSETSSSMRDVDSKVMYHEIVSKIWPALIGIPLVIASIRLNWRQPLVFMLVILSMIYVFGAISGKYSYGRVISYIVLLLHVIIAEYLAMLESRVHEIHVSIWFRRLIVPISVMALFLLLSLQPLKTTLKNVFRERWPTSKPYQFLSQFTNQYDVVLSDINSSWIVPTFGGKVVAAGHPLAFVPDLDVRRSDLDHFFNKEAVLSDNEHQQIIQKYKANYLLLRKSESLNWQYLQQLFMLQGQVVFESDSFVLISLKPT